MSAKIQIASSANVAVKAAITALENEKVEIIDQIKRTYDSRIASMRSPVTVAARPAVTASASASTPNNGKRRRRHGTLRERVQQILANAGKTIRVKDIVAALGDDVNPSHVSQVLNKMAEEGDAERVRHGLYQAA